MKGKIKTLLQDKRCGFITAGSVDYFFHESALQNCGFNDLTKGREVEFEEGEGKRGPRAEDVNV